MKIINVLLTSLLLIGTLPLEVDNSKKMNLYDIKINSLDGTPINLKAYKGQFILFVNVASECGFTNQYDGLQRLYDNYKGKLMVIGVPCNQFGQQETGSNQQIKSFCEENYGVSFIMSEKIDVKGKNQHPLYQWLTDKNLNGVKTTSVKWNFQKYIVGKQGEFIDYFYSLTRPTSSKITKLIK
ncbi:MAG: glutathione peroxidase [Formosa sp.]|nr:glutathione peroxidase [Formosa sp.]